MNGEADQAVDRLNGVRSGARVLIVEDETLVAMLLEDMLADAGYVAVGPVHSVEGALVWVRDQSEQFDYAILDVNLGGQPIFPVAEAMAAQGKGFAFATGYGVGGLPERWRDRPVLQKPFGPLEVEKILLGAAYNRA